MNSYFLLLGFCSSRSDQSNEQYIRISIVSGRVVKFQLKFVVEVGDNRFVFCKDSHTYIVGRKKDHCDSGNPNSTYFFLV